MYPSLLLRISLHSTLIPRHVASVWKSVRQEVKLSRSQCETTTQVETSFEYRCRTSQIHAINILGLGFFFVHCWVEAALCWRGLRFDAIKEMAGWDGIEWDGMGWVIRDCRGSNLSGFEDECCDDGRTLQSNMVQWLQQIEKKLQSNMLNMFEMIACRWLLDWTYNIFCGKCPDECQWRWRFCHQEIATIRPFPCSNGTLNNTASSVHDWRECSAMRCLFVDDSTAVAWDYFSLEHISHKSNAHQSRISFAPSSETGRKRFRHGDGRSRTLSAAFFLVLWVSSWNQPLDDGMRGPRICDVRSRKEHCMTLCDGRKFQSS